MTEILGDLWELFYMLNIMFLFLLPLDLFSTSNLKQIFFKFLHELEVRNKTGMVNNTIYNQLQQFEPPPPQKKKTTKINRWNLGIGFGHKSLFYITLSSLVSLCLYQIKFVHNYRFWNSKILNYNLFSHIYFELKSKQCLRLI